MPQIFNQADILIHPPKKDQYWEEYFGMVLLEAMASKVPIITTNCGAIPEVIGESGIIVEQGNAKQLYTAISGLISSQTKRKQLASLGYKRVTKHYDADKQATKLAQLYLSIT